MCNSDSVGLWRQNVRLGIKILVARTLISVFAVSRTLEGAVRRGRGGKGIEWIDRLRA